MTRRDLWVIVGLIALLALTGWYYSHPHPEAVLPACPEMNASGCR
jgi:hypothetical protein